MGEIYLEMAAHFEQLAVGCRVLAENGGPAKKADKKAAGKKQEEVTREVAIEEVRAVLASKSQDGKTKEIKALLEKYDAGKLSGVKPEDYPALLKEAEAL